MSTVRIYKVAELLGTTSQEVTALLKRDHGIEVKSASSTIEEVVARQFVDRLAKQRRITLPSGDIFAETPVQKGKKPAPAKKAPEPPKPTQDSWALNSRYIGGGGRSKDPLLRCVVSSRCPMRKVGGPSTVLRRAMPAGCTSSVKSRGCGGSG